MRLLSIFLTLALTAPLTASPAAARAGAPVDGIWESGGYSTVVAIGGGRAAFYDTTRIGCAAGPMAIRVSPRRFEGADLAFTVRARRGGLVLHMDGSVGDRNLRPLRALPPACTRPVPRGPLATFDVFWQTFADNYPFFAAKGTDWRAVRDRYRPRVRPDLTDAELFDLLVEMIEPLGDAHTGIRTGDGRLFLGHRPGTTFPTPELEQRIRPYIERRDVHGPLRMFGNERIGYADLPGNLGYLRLIAFAGYTDAGTFGAESVELDRALDAILTPERVRALRGLVIDLRINGGGSDALGIQLASRLTGRPYLAYRKRARNDPADPTRFTRPQPIAVRPAARPPGSVYRGPIAILTGGSTISAGETFTQAMLGRSPRPVRIGENTQGVFSDTMVRSLPNGWLFILPNEEFLTRDGRTFDGTGIPPDLRTPVFTAAEFAAGRDSAFDRAVALLSA